MHTGTRNMIQSWRASTLIVLICRAPVWIRYIFHNRDSENIAHVNRSQDDRYFSKFMFPEHVLFIGKLCWTCPLSEEHLIYTTFRNLVLILSSGVWLELCWHFFVLLVTIFGIEHRTF